jgi:hypothetical protein
MDEGNVVFINNGTPFRLLKRRKSWHLQQYGQTQKCVN